MTSETVRRLTELRDEWLRRAKVKNRDQFRLYWDGFDRGMNQAAEELDSLLRQIREAGEPADSPTSPICQGTFNGWIGCEKPHGHEGECGWAVAPACQETHGKHS